MTFLSYPKYYKTAEGELTPVVTDLVESKSADWDFEVETGIWTLRVKTDGTFQAEHQGNVFTYRLSQMGVGRGDGFQAFEWGDPNWKNYQVIGDAIRWYDVFPKIDLKVRYIHDILKVDVIVKAELMSQIRAEVLDGKLNADDYLTARFDIPNVWVTGEARQGGAPCDLYAERLDVQQPVEFVKDGKVVQKLRLVETYVLDEKGEPIISFEEDNFIRSSQTWQLKKDAAGVAEMSANLGDLAKAKDGDVVIDPSMTIGSAYQDTRLQYQNYSIYGNSTVVNWNQNDQLIFGFDVEDELQGRIIHSAKLRLYVYESHLGSDEVEARAYKITQSWNESNANWYYPWSAGAIHENTMYYGKSNILPHNPSGVVYGGFVNLDVSYILKSHIASSFNDVIDKGFMVKMIDNTNNTILISMSENIEAQRPKLVVECGPTEFGALPGPSDDSVANWTTMDRIEEMITDGLKIARHSAEYDEYGTLCRNFAYACYNNSIEPIPMLPVYTAGWNANWVYPTPSHYANYIEMHLEALSSPVNYITNGTVKYIQLGAEEDGDDKKWSLGPIESYDGGQEFALYYIAAWEKIKNNSSHPEWKDIEIIACGFVDPKTFLHSDYPGYPGIGQYAKAFLNGFLDKLRSESVADPLKYMPDNISIQPYAGQYPPEMANSNDYCDVLTEIHETCHNKGFVPNYSHTEWGFSPTKPESQEAPPPTPLNGSAVETTTESGYKPNADNITQSVYILRFMLHNGLAIARRNSNPIQGIGWKQSIYFHHCREYGDGVFSPTTALEIKDWGFHNFDVFPGNSRPIRYICRNIFLNNQSNYPRININSNTSRVLISNASTFENSGWDANGTPPRDYVQRSNYCFWQNGTNDFWLAIWRYKTVDRYLYDTTGVTKSVTIPGDYRLFARTIYRYYIQQDSFNWEPALFSDDPLIYKHLPNYDTLNATLVDSSNLNFSPSSSISNLSYNSQTNETTFNISGVTENPIFVQFTN